MNDSGKQGLEIGIAALNRLSAESLQHVCQAALDAHKLFSFHAELHHEDSEPDINDLNNSVRTLSHFFREAVSKQLDGVLLSRLMKTYLVQPDTLSAIQTFWDKHKDDVSKEVPVSNIGKLKSMEWKVSVASSSSQCRALCTPVVTLQLCIQQPSGVSETRCLELTLPQFKKLSQQLKEMAASMSTV